MPRILYAEDDALCRIPTAMTLRNYGYEVVEAWNGREALQALEAPAAAFDVIVTDMRMPVLDGYEFLRAYKGTTPVIVLSAWADGDEEELRDAVVFARITKPFVISDLREAIERAVKHERR